MRIYFEIPRLWVSLKKNSHLNPINLRARFAAFDLETTYNRDGIETIFGVILEIFGALFLQQHTSLILARLKQIYDRCGTVWPQTQDQTHEHYTA